MKTHDAIKALNAITTALKNSPFETIEELGKAPTRKADAQSVDVPRALQMLVALSSFDRLEWLQVINDYEFPIEVRTRDASRDIMWKLLRFLEADKEAREKLMKATPKRRSETSAELTQALEFLLKT